MSAIVSSRTSASRKRIPTVWRKSCTCKSPKPANLRARCHASKPASWDEFLAVLNSVNTNAEIPADFLNAKEREQTVPDADPFAGWRE